MPFLQLQLTHTWNIALMPTTYSGNTCTYCGRRWHVKQEFIDNSKSVRFKRDKRTPGNLQNIRSIAMVNRSILVVFILLRSLVVTALAQGTLYSSQNNGDLAPTFTALLYVKFENNYIRMSLMLYCNM